MGNMLDKREFMTSVKEWVGVAKERADRLLTAFYNIDMEIELNNRDKGFGHGVFAGRYEGGSVFGGTLVTTVYTRTIYAHLKASMENCPWDEPYTIIRDAVCLTVYHEAGHGICELINDWLDETDDFDEIYEANMDLFNTTFSNEEKTVEDFAVCFYENRVGDSRLFQVMKLIDPKLQESRQSSLTISESRLREIISEEIRKFRTYGLGDFDSSRFNKPENWTRDRIVRNKPFGGLWGTPVDDDSYGWLKWNENERYLAYDDDDYFEFTFKPNAKIYVIQSKKDIARLPQQWENPNMAGKVDDFYYDVAKKYGQEFYPDFEKIAEKYDGIEFHVNGETMDALYGWDCDSVLVLNPDAIEVVRHNEQEAKGYDYHRKLAGKKYPPEENELPWDN